MPSALFLLALLSVLSPILLIIYNIYLHPLRNIPGPKTWAASRIFFIRSTISGNFIHDVEKLHSIYGPVIRLAPNEVTFAHPESFHHIYHGRQGHKQFLKDPVWWAREPGLPDSLVSAIDPVKHASMRKVLSYGFTPRALKEQESILQRYVSLLIARLSEKAAKGESFDMVPWYNFTIFDIFGDLAFAEPFNCLQSTQYHSWIALLFNSVKLSPYIVSLRFYPGLVRLVNLVTPKKLRDMKEQHFRQIAEKVDRRMNWETERPDLMQHVIQHKDAAGMTDEEVKATFMVLVTAGSETTATTLCGITHYLLDMPDIRAKLAQDVRTSFANEDEINMDSVKNLQYLNAVISEGLRLCPPIPYMLPRKVPGGGDEVCGTWLPGGTSVSIQSWTLFRHDDYFTDAKTFIPERWLPEASKPGSRFEHDQRDAVQAFSMGPRKCIGRELAWTEMRLVLARILWSFDMERAGKRVGWEDLKTFFLVEKQPIELRLISRL